MTNLIAEKRLELEAVCRQYCVRRLAPFVSAPGSSFDEERSDLDFLVDFQEVEFGQNVKCYFGLREASMGLFNRPVDLVMEGAIQNPYLLRSLVETRELLHAA